MNIAVLSGQESGSFSCYKMMISPSGQCSMLLTLWGSQKTQIQPLTMGTFREEKCSPCTGLVEHTGWNAWGNLEGFPDIWVLKDE